LFFGVFAANILVLIVLAVSLSWWVPVGASVSVANRREKGYGKDNDVRPFGRSHKLVKL